MYKKKANEKPKMETDFLYGERHCRSANKFRLSLSFFLSLFLFSRILLCFLLIENYDWIIHWGEQRQYVYYPLFFPILPPLPLLFLSFHDILLSLLFSFSSFGVGLLFDWIFSAAKWVTPGPMDNIVKTNYKVSGQFLRFHAVFIARWIPPARLFHSPGPIRNHSPKPRRYQTQPGVGAIAIRRNLWTLISKRRNTHNININKYVYKRNQTRRRWAEFPQFPRWFHNVPCANRDTRGGVRLFNIRSREIINVFTSEGAMETRKRIDWNT